MSKFSRYTLYTVDILCIINGCEMRGGDCGGIGDPAMESRGLKKV